MRIEKKLVKGFDKSIPYTIYSNEESNLGTGIIFPGLGYTIKMPLLFYTVEALIESGFDVITMDHNYADDESFLDKTMEQRGEHLKTDVDLFYDEIKQQGFDKINLLVGKSLGTRSIGHLMTEHPELSGVKIILLTPILNDSRLIEAISKNTDDTLIVIGDNDPFFDREVLESLKDSGKIKCYILNGADHGLQLEGDIQKTLVALQGVVQEILVMLRGIKQAS